MEDCSGPQNLGSVKIVLCKGGKSRSLINRKYPLVDREISHQEVPMREGLKELIKILSYLHKALYELEGLVIAMYRGGGSTRDISKTKITGVLKEKVED